MPSNRGVVYVGPGKVEVRSIDFPKLVDPRGKKAEHGVILKVVATNICGSDPHMVRGRTTAPPGEDSGAGHPWKPPPMSVCCCHNFDLRIHDDRSGTRQRAPVATNGTTPIAAPWPGTTAKRRGWIVGRRGRRRCLHHSHAPVGRRQVGHGVVSLDVSLAAPAEHSRRQRDVTITCASSTASLPAHGTELRIPANASAAESAAVFRQAVESAEESGAPVVLHF